MKTTGLPADFSGLVYRQTSIHCYNLSVPLNGEYNGDDAHYDDVDDDADNKLNVGCKSVCMLLTPIIYVFLLNNQDQ